MEQLETAREPALEIGAASLIGHRERNEDAFLVLPSQRLFAVADGLGGYEGGEVASAVVLQALAEVVTHVRATPGAHSWEAALVAAFRHAEREVSSRQVGRLSMMGSTLSTVLFAEGWAYLGHIGDSRIYCLREGELRQLSSDHTVIEERLRAGLEVTAIHRSVYRNVLSRAIGIEASGEPDVFRQAIRRGDLFLLCSDGVHGPVTHSRIRELLGRGSAQEVAERLTREAIGSGGQDNATAVVVRVL